MLPPLVLLLVLMIGAAYILRKRRGPVADDEGRTVPSVWRDDERAGMQRAALMRQISHLKSALRLARQGMNARAHRELCKVIRG